MTMLVWSWLTRMAIMLAAAFWLSAVFRAFAEAGTHWLSMGPSLAGVWVSSLWVLHGVLPKGKTPPPLFRPTTPVEVSFTAGPMALVPSAGAQRKFVALAHAWRSTGREAALASFWFGSSRSRSHIELLYIWPRPTAPSVHVTAASQAPRSVTRLIPMVFIWAWSRS